MLTCSGWNDHGSFEFTPPSNCTVTNRSVDYGALLRHDGWRILLVIAASTLMVMLVTAFTVELAVRMRRSHEA